MRKSWHATLVVPSILYLMAVPCRAGMPQKWEDLPKAVRETVLANGGNQGMTVDKENELIDGKAVYEAGIKAKDGNIHDLVISEDGKLIETKTDDAADAVAERAARAAKLLKGIKFTRPLEITNPYLPMAKLKQDVLEGAEDGKQIRVERTAKPQLRKTFTFGDLTVEALAVEDREFEDGKLVEVAIDYFAQDDDGAVYYLGEEVDEYEDGKVVGHEGAWLVGQDTPAPGVLFPAHPKLGQRFRSEDVSRDISELDEIVSLAEKVTTPAGIFENCVKVKETLADGSIEYKYYAKGVGVVREVPPNGDERLKSHATTSTP